MLYLASTEERETLVRMLAEMEESMLDAVTGPGHEPGEPDDARVAPPFEDEPLPDLDLVADSGQVPEAEAADAEPLLGPDTMVRTTPSGEEVLFVGQVLETWLRGSPGGPLRMGEEKAGFALITMVSSWASTLAHRMAGGPRTLDELAEATGATEREGLEGQLEAMEMTGLLDTVEGPDGEALYTASEWLRRAIAPLVAAARHERRQRDEDTRPPDALDIAGVFLLTLPMVELPADLAGACRLKAMMPGDRITSAGVDALVEGGRVTASTLDPDDPPPPSYATGSPLDWMDAIVDPRRDRIKVGGDDHRLAEALVEGLHELLFGGPLVTPEEIIGRPL